MLNIAIVDDSDSDRESIRFHLTEFAKDRNYEIDPVEFRSGEELLSNYRSGFDMILMDIEMPGLSGIETSLKIRQLDSTVMIVFITNIAQYALKGYEASVFDYIIKPISKYSFALKMERALSRISASERDFVVINSKNGAPCSIDKKDITYVEARDGSVVYHTRDNEYAERVTLKDAEKKISLSTFAYCNKHCLVNLKYVRLINKNSVMVGDTELPVSLMQKRSFVGGFFKYISGRR